MSRSIASHLFSLYAAATSLLFASGSACSNNATEPLRLYQATGVNTLRSVEMARINDGVVLSGTITKRFHSRHTGFPHIHVDLLDRTGKVLVSERIDVHGPLHTNRYWRRFTATARDLPSDTAAIRVSSHSRWNHSVQFNS